MATSSEAPASAPTRSRTRRPRWPTTTSSRPTRTLVEAVAREGADWAHRPDLGGRRARPAPGGRSSSDGWRTRTRRSCGPTTATATGSTRSSSIPPGTSCSAPSVANELHSLPWRDPQPGAHVARGAAFMCFCQAEAGVGCPISMTYSVIPALRHQPELAEEWEPRFTSSEYDPRNRPARREARRPGRHGDDREAGRLRRPRQHHGRPPAERRRPRRRVRADRPQVVHVGADVRRLPGAGPGRRRHLLLPLPALDARRRAQPLPPAAAQGQARQPLQRLQSRSSSTAPGPGWSARRAPGCGRSSRWSTTPASTASQGGATGMRAGVAQAIHHASHRSTFGTTLIDQPADAERARRPRDRVRGGDDLGDAPRARLRRGDRRRRAGPGLQADLERGAQVLDLQAGPEPRGRVPRVPRRQRLRRGVRDAPPLPGEPAELDLGGLGQRPVPRRPAGDDQEPGLARGLLRRGRRGSDGAAGRRPRPRRCARSSAT